MAALPELTVNYQELPRTVGGSFLYTKVGVRKFTLDFMLIPDRIDDMDDCVAEFGQWLTGDNYAPSKLEFSDRPDRYIMAQVESDSKVKDLFYYGDTSISFIAVDPHFYMYAGTQKTGNSPISVPYLGDIVQPFTAEFSVSKDCSRIALTSDRTSKKIQLDGTFKSGTNVTIDNSKKQILLNNLVNMSVLSLDSEWFLLEKGTNVLTVKLDNAASTAAITITSKIAVN